MMEALLVIKENTIAMSVTLIVKFINFDIKEFLLDFVSILTGNMKFSSGGNSVVYLSIQFSKSVIGVGSKLVRTEIE